MCKRMADSDNDNDNDNDNANVIIPRHVPSNPYNYSGAQLAERKKTLKDLAEVFHTSHTHTPRAAPPSAACATLVRRPSSVSSK